MARKKKGHGFALGAMVGGLLGGVTALLFAPKSGKNMRKDISKSCHRASNKTHKLVNGARKKVNKATKKPTRRR